MAKPKRVRTKGKPRQTVLCAGEFTASQTHEGRQNPEKHWFVKWPDGSVERVEARLSEAQAKLLLEIIHRAFYRGVASARTRIYDALGLEELADGGGRQ